MGQAALEQMIIKNPLFIAHIDSPALSLQLLAVQTKPSALSVIIKPHAEAVSAGLAANGAAISYVKSPSAALQMLALCHPNGVGVYRHYLDKSLPFKIGVLELEFPGFTVFFEEVLARQLSLIETAQLVRDFKPESKPIPALPSALTAEVSNVLDITKYKT